MDMRPGIHIHIEGVWFIPVIAIKVISGNGYHGGIVCTEMFGWQKYGKVFIPATLGQMFS